MKAIGRADRPGGDEMSRVARSRTLLMAILGAALMTMTSVVAVLAGDINGPFPK